MRHMIKTQMSRWEIWQNPDEQMQTLGEEVVNLLVVGGEGSGKSALIRWDTVLQIWPLSHFYCYECGQKHPDLFPSVTFKSASVWLHKIQNSSNICVAGYCWASVRIYSQSPSPSSASPPKTKIISIIAIVIMITIRLLLGKYAIGESRGFLLHSGLMGQVCQLTMVVISDIFLLHHHNIITEQSAGEGDWVSSPAPWDPSRMDPGSCRTPGMEWKCSKLTSGGGCSSCSDWSVVEKSKQSFLISTTQCFPWLKPRLRNIPGSLNCHVRPLQSIGLRSKPPHRKWTVIGSQKAWCQLKFGSWI